MKLIAFSLVVGSLLSMVWMGRAAGWWLVAEDPLEPAVAIAVLGGRMPFRAKEAADLYHAGYAPEIWLPAPEGAAEHEPIKKLGFNPYEQDLYYKVLERFGVPRRAVRVLHPVSVKNTREEVSVISKALRKAGGGTVIIVTSPTHTRRLRAVWRMAAWPLDGMIVRYTRHEPRRLKLERWWTREEEKGLVVRELAGLVDAWFGFPMILAGR